MTLCQGECGGDPDEHRRGYTSTGTIHWADRKVTRHGIRNFLLLAASAELGGETPPMWEFIWSINRSVIERTRTLGIRIPRRYSEHDRTVVRYMLIHDKRGDKAERVRARKWAHN